VSWEIMVLIYLIGVALVILKYHIYDRFKYEVFRLLWKGITWPWPVVKIACLLCLAIGMIILFSLPDIE